tara:strand:+ start:60 stop:2162 length:2103 start_codon:yes stop_codon:yes gene_type:complete
MPHKPGFIHSGKDETSWNYFELPFGSGADYKKPIALENLPYTPAVLGEMLENKEKEREVDIEGLGKGRLVISKQNNNKPFFYPDQSEEYTAKKSRQLQIGEIVGNLPLITSPLTTLGKGVPKIVKTKRETPRRLMEMSMKESSSEGAINLKQSIDGAYNMPTQQSANYYKRAANVAKKNHISLTDAFKYLDSIQKGIRPDKPIKPGNITGVTNKGLIKDFTSGSLKKGGLFDPNRDDTTKFMFKEDSMGDYPGRKKNETYPDYFRRFLTTYGARPDANGQLVMTSEAFANIKNSSIRREVAQLLLTDINQGVKGSFLQQSQIKNTQLNKDLAEYNKKYGARADLHHGYPSVIGIEFYLDNPHMGNQWHKYQAIAAKYGNVPGQPMVEGKDNLISVPSSIPSTITKRKTKIKRDNPAYVEAKEGLAKEGRKIPQHLHQIIHDSFLTNEMGQSGKKFWEKWDPIIMQKGEAGWLEAYEDFNEIIARNRAMYKEALAQLDVFFSKADLSGNPEKLVDLLEEYIAKGKITIGQGLVRDKSGNVVITKEGTDTALSTMKFKEYQQDAVQYTVEDALRDFKEDANKLLEKDPRLKDVATEVSAIPGLTQAEIELAEELLFKIKWYNSIFLTDGKSRAYQVTQISAAQHKKNVDKYYDLIQLKLPIKIPKAYIQLKTFNKIKLPNFEKQLELILDPQPEQLDIFNDR